MPRYKIVVETEEVFSIEELESIADDVYGVLLEFCRTKGLESVEAKYD